jgi:hypothetical protein
MVDTKTAHRRSSSSPITRGDFFRGGLDSSAFPSSGGYTVATRGYSFRERQPVGPVIEGHADPIDDLLNDRVSLDTP